MTKAQATFPCAWATNAAASTPPWQIAAPYPQIHVQHYIVWPPRNESYPHTYGDGEDMRDAIVANGAVRLVLSGHYHAGVEPFAEANAWFATVPAFCETPHPFWAYDLTGSDLAWTQYELDEFDHHV